MTFAVCNTDSQQLSRCPVPVKIQLGDDGLGAGGDPVKGRLAAEASDERIRTLLSDGTKMAFVTASMGGGTGTGAGPIVAKVAKEMGILTIGIVTIPFSFEGQRKIIRALQGMEEMRDNVDALLVALMEREVHEAVRAGADAVVVGALTPQGDIDIDATRRWVVAADGRPVTFHRAFDRCRQPLEALEQLIGLGVARVLTSGQAPTAEAGIPLLRQLVQQADGRIIILPGGGVTSLNARHIIQSTGTTEIHGSASRLMSNGQKETDADEVRAILKAL